MFSIKQKAAQTAKRAGFLTAGIISLTVCAVFLTLAAWLHLLTVVSAVQAALILAVVYLCIGLLLIVFSKNGADIAEEIHQPSHAKSSAPPPEAPPLVQAFLYGIQAGSRGPNSGS